MRKRPRPHWIRPPEDAARCRGRNVLARRIQKDLDELVLERVFDNSHIIDQKGRDIGLDR